MVDKAVSSLAKLIFNLFAEHSSLRKIRIFVLNLSSLICIVLRQLLGICVDQRRVFGSQWFNWDALLERPGGNGRGGRASASTIEKMFDFPIPLCK